MALCHIIFEYNLITQQIFSLLLKNLDFRIDNLNMFRSNPSNEFLKQSQAKPIQIFFFSDFTIWNHDEI